MMKTNIKKMAALISAAVMSVSIMMPAYAETTAETTARDVINSATSSTIAAAMSQYVVDAGKTEPYGVLPECDQLEINERILENAPYSSDDELAAAFQKALEYTTQVDADWYDTVLLEDFSDGIDSSLEILEKTPLVGDKALLDDLERKSLNISGKDEMSMATWGKGVKIAEQAGGKQYLTKTIDDPNVIITGYFYNANTMSTADYYEFRLNEKKYRVGVVADQYYVYYNNSDEPVKIKSIDKNTWHKVEFDGASKPGYITAYFDGTELFTVQDEIKLLKFGIFSSTENYCVFFTDNIAIAKPKTDAQFLEDVNSKKLAASSVKRATRFIEKSTELYNALPECDRTEIAERLEDGKPYASISEFTAAYQTALEYTTGVDKDNYTEAWSEDFSQGLDDTKWTTKGTLVEGAVGEGQPTKIGDVRQSLNISGTENASIGIFGPSTTEGKTDYITRTIDNSKSIVTVYFYDTNSETINPRFGVYMNDNCAITRTDRNGYYGYFVDGEGNASKVAATQGWHKIVFDGLTDETGLVTAYLDGNEIFQTANPISEIKIGNRWTDVGYGIYWVDNVSVATEKLAEKVKIVNRSTEITDNVLPANATKLSVQIENWERKTDYIIATYKDKQLVDVTILAKDDEETEAAQVTITDVDEMKVFCWDGVGTMKSAGDMIHLQ